ncbi:lipopolysaccharide-binding protein [Siniperca chuatsi]|uniref:Bactericidal permeability-increasing protein n=1 Tax=Siniperca chuatsi TaxID=119488 RepID=A0A8T9JF04_SINCH|nr:lipopolysaccharide-binding protein [Siniperca chuatsi]XP_044066357.1 lipopolysaccharide-binding protein [Siniperca chuatsi]XP_044066358.1 lipopolysaccharide-binding protein [Siniperca chuatsi]UOF71358.1 bactericidal permeability increasing protein [Siniperca chuatsi]
MLPSIIVVLMLIPLTCGENPAIQVILTNKGLQYGKHVGAGWIQDKLELVTLPDISGEIHISIFGSIDYTLTGITITKCDFPEPSVEFYQDVTGFKTSISGLSVALTGGWITHLGVIHDRGSFNMAIFSVDVTSVVTLGKDPDGHLSVTSVSCDAHIGDVDIQFHGGASWIFQPFVKHFKGYIRSEIEHRVCPDVEESIVMLEGYLQAMKVSFDVDQDLTLDLPLTGLPVIDASNLNLGFKGEFYSIKTHTDPPFESQPFTVPEQSGYMLSVGLSEFTLNSASYGYYSAGLFQALINDSMIPPGSHLHLNTSAMGPFIPQLPKMYPGLLMNLQVYAREVPLFSFQPGAVKLGFQGAVKAFAIQPNGTQTPLFKLNVDSKFSGKVWIAGGRLKGSVTMNNFTLMLVSSEVGTFQTDAMESIARIGARVVLAKLNEKLGKGVVLPRMKQAQLVNTVLEVEEGFIAISSDAQVLLPDRDFN